MERDPRDTARRTVSTVITVDTMSTEPRDSSGLPSESESPPFIWNGGRREYKEWFKVQAIEECQKPGSSVSIVARRYDINANVLFRWRREYRLGLLRPAQRPSSSEAFAPVGVIGNDGRLEPPVIPSAPKRSVAKVPVRKPSAVVKVLPAPAPRASDGSIELRLAGNIKLRVQGEVDKEMLRHVLAAAREFA